MSLPEMYAEFEPKQALFLTQTAWDGIGRAIDTIDAQIVRLIGLSETWKADHPYIRDFVKNGYARAAETRMSTRQHMLYHLSVLGDLEHSCRLAVAKSAVKILIGYESLRLVNHYGEKEND